MSGGKLFGLQNGGECRILTRSVYKALGNASDCANGVGGPHSIEVYFVLEGGKLNNIYLNFCDLNRLLSFVQTNAFYRKRTKGFASTLAFL